MNQEVTASKQKRTSYSKRKNLEEDKETCKVSVSKISPPGIDAEISSETKSKGKKNSTTCAIIKREESSLHSTKQKGKVGNTLLTKEKTPSKRVPRRRKLDVRQEDEGSTIDFGKGDRHIKTDLQGPKRKRTREATCHAESQLKILTKQKKLTKGKSRFLPKLNNLREESSLRGPLRENLVEVVKSTTISENEEGKSEFQSKELICYETLFSENIKTKGKKRSVEIGRTRKISLKGKSRARKNRKVTKKLDIGALNDVGAEQTHLLSGSRGSHSLRKLTSSREADITISNNVHNLETSDEKEQQEGIQSNNCSVDVKSNDLRKNIQSKETAIALKLANDTSGFVRTTLKAVEDSKCMSLKTKEGISKRKNEDVNIENKQNKLLATVAQTIAERYKATLEALQSTQTLTAQKLIEELAAIQLTSKGNTTKVRKLGKRHIGKSMRTNFKKDIKDEPTKGEIAKHNVHLDVSKDGKPDARHRKPSRKTKNNKENQMTKFGTIDKDLQSQGFVPNVATKKPKPVVISGFDRLMSGARGNKEFESALAPIVSSHDEELGWTKHQEQALQDSYLSEKQIDGDFGHLVPKEVPGISAKKCYDNFYSRHPTPNPEDQEPPTKFRNESELPSSLSLDTKPKGASLKVAKKEKQFEAQKTIQNILRRVDDMEGYGINNSFVEDSHHKTVQYGESTLDRMEDEKAVILQSSPMKDYNSVVSIPHLEGDTSNDSQAKAFLQNVTISGARNLSDKENNQPRNGQDINNKKSGVPRVELILKQVDHGESFVYDKPKTICNTRKKKIIKTSNVYLHSKDALDFGDSTLDAIQRAKQELRNVFSRTGSRGGPFFDIEASQIAE